METSTDAFIYVMYERSYIEKYILRKVCWYHSIVDGKIKGEWGRAAERVECRIFEGVVNKSRC